MATILLSFVEGIDRKNNTKAKFRFLFAGLGARQVTFQLMGEWRVAGRLIQTPVGPLAFSMDNYRGACLILRVLCFDTFLIKGRSFNYNRKIGLLRQHWRAHKSGAGADANAICFETRKNLRCLSSDRGHAGTEGAVGPTEMCAMSRPDLGSKRGACRAEILSQVCDRCRGQRDKAANIPT